MSNELENLSKNANELVKQKKFEELIVLLNDEVLRKFKDAKLFALRSIAHFRLHNNADKMMYFAQKAIVTDPNFFMGYFAQGCAYMANYDYGKAVLDFSKSIELNPDYVNAYYNRGVSWYEKHEYDRAIKDFIKAIELDPDYSVAYYSRGLTIIAIGESLDQGVKDFEKYLVLTPKKDDVWAIRARNFIQELHEKIKDNDINIIGDLISKIKKLLMITEGCVTHYTGLSVTKKLIFEIENKFRISEGAFLNDTSEGTELFKFLEHKFVTKSENGLLAETFAPKPFIGSFVSENKHDDLSLWRFYGKENGVEAKGCALTIRMNEFVETINQSIITGDDKSVKSDSDDINFYRVAYWDHDLSKINFQIPNSSKEDEVELNRLIGELKDKVKRYKIKDKSILEKYLNSIAFLFKSDVYKNENELRLVIKGIEFEKKFDMEANPPRVYIELINIRHLIEQITLGPKVDKPDEWAAAIHYSYDRETDPSRKPKKILISHLPYK